MSSLALVPVPARASPQQLAHLAVQSLASPSSRRNYSRALGQYLATGYPLDREHVQQWLNQLRQAGGGPSTLNVALAAIRLLAREAHARGSLAAGALGGLERIRGQPVRGVRAGNWLELPQVRQMLKAAEQGRHGSRDAAICALMLGCGLRRAEVAALEWSHWQQRGGRWVIVDLVGKGRRVRTIPCPDWAASYVEAWRAEQAGQVSDSERVAGLTAQGVFYVVRDVAARACVGQVTPHDLRRTYARLSRDGGASIEQISRTLGHSSVQTTERYIGALLELRPGMGCGDHIRLD